MSLTLDPEESRRRLDEIFALHEILRQRLFAAAKRDYPEGTEKELWEVVAHRVEMGRRGKWGEPMSYYYDQDESEDS